MRAVIQRARGASVTVDEEVIGAFDGPGLVVLVGVHRDDTPAQAAWLADKVWSLRLFDVPTGGVASASDLNLPLLVISQFTLYGSARKGRRPTWEAAADRSVAEPLVDAVVARLRSLGARVETGSFGAMMDVRLCNDGPVTLVVDTP